jgi:ribosome-binding factor A
MDRTKRLNSLIVQVLNEIIIYQLKDPRLKMVSISDAHITKDLKHCKVFVSVLSNMDNEEHVRNVMECLNRAKGFMKKELGAKIKIRYTPELYFKFDDTVRHAVKISSILKDIIPQEPADNTIAEDDK